MKTILYRGVIMKLEYKYKTNIIKKAFPFIWFVLINVAFLYGVYVYVINEDYSQIVIYVVIYIFFIVLFRFLLLTYVMEKSILILDDDKLVYFGLMGEKVVPYETIMKIDFKVKVFTMLLIIYSKENAPITINLKRLNDDPEKIRNEVDKRVVITEDVVLNEG